jgi:hypothetical protein
MQINEYTSIPQKVIAIQYFPYSGLPSVEEQYQTIDQPYVNSNSVPQQQRVIVGAKCAINGKMWSIDPRDYVIYDAKTMAPIMALSEKNFKERYISTKVFCLCEECSKKAESAMKPTAIESIEQIKEMIANGNVPIPMSTPKGTVNIFTLDQLLAVYQEAQAQTDPQPQS